MGVVPKKHLGQHFLVDENILGVIERLAGLSSDDVVLEIGPGLGVLTRFLADRVAHVHAVEIDRSLEQSLREVPHTDLHWGDALALDLAAFERRYDVDVWERFGGRLQPYVDENLLRHESRRLWLTRRGMLLAHEVMAIFV